MTVNGENTEFLMDIRNGIEAMISDPQHGFGAEITDAGFDFTEETAEIVFEMTSGARVELRIKRLAN